MTELVWAIMGFTFGGIIILVSLIGLIIYIVEKSTGQNPYFESNIVTYFICGALMVASGFVYLYMRDNPIGG